VDIKQVQHNSSITQVSPLRDSFGNSPAMAPVFTIDTHTHVVPEIWREMLISAGYATKEENGTAIYVDGFRTPDFSIETYVANQKKWGYNYSVISITCPGVSPLNGNSKAKKVARELNNQMAEWIKQNPGTLGAWACLPLPDVEAAIEEARVK
jgi:predicted TIM-barrel fold metal-dependent hydrolase